jgi:hypothetical protein
MELKKRRYVLCVEFNDGIIKFVKSEKGGSHVFTENPNEAMEYWYNGYYSVTQSRSKLVALFKKKYKRGDRPRSFIKLKTW